MVDDKLSHSVRLRSSADSDLRFLCLESLSLDSLLLYCEFVPLHYSKQSNAIVVVLL